jgi:hypothetical protein
MAALFANMVVQQSNLALMMLGRMPNPQTGETIQDLQAAKMFIDQLEMLEHKTKGNLSRDEDRLIKQSLTTLRMAFVEAIEQQPGAATSDSARPATSQESTSASSPLETPPSSDDESRKKFSKKY